MDTTDWAYNAPYLQEEVDAEQVTVDAWYFSELQKKETAIKRYFKIKNFPMPPTPDEQIELIELERILKK